MPEWDQGPGSRTRLRSSSSPTRRRLPTAASSTSWEGLPSRDRPPLAAALAAGLLLVAIVALTGRVYAGDAERPLRVTGDADPRAGADPVAGGDAGWRTLADAPLAGRAGHTGVWTGAELLVWGGAAGDRAFADGAAYNPAADAWRPLAAAPLAGRSRHVAVWTGAQMLVWGGEGPDGAAFVNGAAYDPVGDRWRAMAPAPLSPRRDPLAAWTGRELVVVGGLRGDERLTGAAAYDVAGDAWRSLPDAPLPVAGQAAGLWTATRFVAWSGRSGAAYHPGADRWQQLPDVPRDGAGRGTLLWTGDKLLVLGTHLAGRPRTAGLATAPPVDDWHVLGPSPLPPSTLHRMVWTGTEALFWGGLLGHDLRPGERIPRAGVRYDPAGDAWAEIPAAPIPGRLRAAAVWTGEELLVWGGSDRRRDYADGAAFRP